MKNKRIFKLLNATYIIQYNCNTSQRIYLIKKYCYSKYRNYYNNIEIDDNNIEIIIRCYNIFFIRL